MFIARWFCSLTNLLIIYLQFRNFNGAHNFASSHQGVEGVLLGELLMCVFSGAPPRHDAPPAPDPCLVAVEAHMLPDAAASLYTGRDRLRFDWGARQRFTGSDCGIGTAVAHECVALISLESPANTVL